MSLTVRTCPTCGRDNAEISRFCADCATSLEHVPTALLLTGRVSTIAIGQQSRRNVQRGRDGAGSGLIVMGSCLLITGILIGGTQPLGAWCWAGGLAAMGIGLIQMLGDWSSFTRTGSFIAVFGVAALALVGGQSLERDQIPFLTSPPQPTATVDPSEPSSDLAVASPADDGSAVGLVANVPMYRGGPDRTGQNPGPPPEGDPHVLWRFDTSSEIYASTVVVNGIAYTGTQSGFLIALKATSGSELWRYDLGNYAARSTPAVVDGVLFIGAGFTLHAIDAETGSVRWRIPIRLAGSSSPVVDRDVVYVASQEGVIYAVSARDGEEIWNFRAGGIIFSSLAVTSTGIFFGSDDGNLYAIELENGRQRWQIATGGEVFSTPAVAGDTVYVTSQSQVLLALDIANGRERWRFAAGGSTSPAIADGTVYVGSDDSGILALDAQTGEQLWLFATGTAVTASPVIARDMLVAGSGTTLFALDLDGNQIWRYPIGDTVEASPTVAGGIIYVGSHDGFLYAIGGLGVTATPGAA